MNRRRILAILAVIVALPATAMVVVRPSNQREWQVEQAVLPRAEITQHAVTIHDVRNFTYDSAGHPLPAYYDHTYDLDRIETVWLVLSPFGKDWRGPAHSFLSFGFADSQYVAISMEARREKGEQYSLWKGMARRYEVIYVIADERDVIRLRTNVWGDEVYVYPIRASKEKVRQLFVEMLQHANDLHEHPEFYNTLWNNCTTTILHHANRVSSTKIPYGRSVLLPGYADELAVKLGLINAEGSVEEVRRRFLVNERARRFAADPLFSARIRESAPAPVTSPIS
jgi:uncharacterized protein DUF4105